MFVRREYVFAPKGIYIFLVASNRLGQLVFARVPMFIFSCSSSLQKSRSDSFQWYSGKKSNLSRKSLKKVSKIVTCLSHGPSRTEGKNLGPPFYSANTIVIFIYGPKSVRGL